MRHAEPAAVADPRYTADESIVLRYHRDGSAHLGRGDLEKSHLREGARILPFLVHRDVPVFLLDETTRCETGTFEAYVACVAMAQGLRSGRPMLMSSSGGNLGTALAEYAAHAGIDFYSFHPAVNLPLLDDRVFGRGSVRLVAVADAQRTRDMVLDVRARVMRRLGYDPLVPKPSWRYQAFGYRGHFLLDVMRERDLRFRAFAQTISAGFGPLGTYRALRDAADASGPPDLPRFLGVQQRGNCYMYQRWKACRVPGEDPLIVPTLFDRNPNRCFQTYPEIARLLEETGGDLIAVSQAEFDRTVTPSLLSRLAEVGIRHSLQDGRPVARSGLMALAGVLKAIDRGSLTEGPVLVSMADGVRPMPKPCRPSHLLADARDSERLARELIAAYGA
jgi:hypothetical protein